MGKNLAGKAGFIVAILVIFAFGIIGIPHNGLKQSITNRIHLGLDLKGGTHLVLQVHVAEAINSQTDRDMQALNTALAATGATAAKLDPLHPETITISGGSATQQSAIHDDLTASDYAGYDVSAANGGYTMTLKQSYIRDLEQRTLDTSIDTIRQRVDSLGVSEPVVEPYNLGDYQILVQLPGVDDPARVKEVMQSTAMLEIRQALDNGRTYGSEQEALAAHGGILPSDAVVIKGKSIGSRTASSENPDVYYVISRVSAVSGRDLRSAEAGREDSGRPDVIFTLTRDGGDRFWNFTSAHVGDFLAVVLDGKVQEVANIKEGIRDTGRITGSFTDQQTKDLSMVLRSGALPASIKYLEERTVGPSLGADSVRQGVRAAIVGMMAVMIFMLIYYRFAGINADLALVLNLLILLGFLGFSGATLTLPGIAGLILTVGMGVDSNVLIFERIREELRAGKTPPSAVEQGFGHAWVTIVDTHVTTIVSAAILFLFGTGPVKGFAVTLTFGLLANLFTAVFVSRTIFESILNRHQRGEALSI